MAIEQVHWVGIAVFRKNPSGERIFSKHWDNLPWEVRTKWNWYFRYRAALAQVQFPHDYVTFHWGNKPAQGPQLLEINRKGSIMWKRRHFTMKLLHKKKLITKNRFGRPEKTHKNNMKQVAHQGDVQIFSICEIPTDAKKVEKQYIAASERSGSFHALFGKYDMYELENGFVVECHEECVLNHSLESILKQTGVTLEEAKVLEKKDHRHTVLPAGKYIFGIQNRFDPMEAIKKRVID